MALKNTIVICYGYIAIPKSFLSSLAKYITLKPGHRVGRPAKVRKALFFKGFNIKISKYI